jgi:uncharacterized membrane protein
MLSDMNSPNALRRLEQLVWTLIYGGLLAVVVGVAMERSQSESGLLIVVYGVLATLVGVVLIGVRSLLPRK